MPLRRIFLCAVLLVLPAWVAALRAGETADDPSRLTPPQLPDKLPPLILYSPAYVKQLAHAAEIGRHNDRIEALRELARYRSRAFPVADRIRKLLDDPAADICRTAADTLYAMGGGALPQWFDALKSRDGFTRRLAVTALAEPWLNQLADHEVLFSRLLPLLHDPDPLVRQPAAFALFSLWPEAEPALTRAMKSGDNVVKQVAIEQLLEKGGTLLALRPAPPPSAVEAAVPSDVKAKPRGERFADFEEQVFGHLLRQMKSRNAAQRDRAFEVLLHFRSGQSQRQLAVFLVIGLEDHAPAIFLDAASKLKRLGPQAVPALIVGTRSKDAWIRKICVENLAGRIEAMNDEKEDRDPKAVAAMTAALDDSNHDVRRRALIWAESLREPPPGAVDKLAAWMSRENDAFNYMYPKDRARGAALLGDWGAQPQASVPALIRALDIGYGTEVRLAAVRSLGHFGIDAMPAAPRLLQFLRQKDRAVASAAAETLTVLGLEIQVAAGRILKDEGRDNREVPARLGAVQQLPALGPDGLLSVATLRILLADTRNDPPVCIEVVHVLRAIGPGAAPAVTDLSALLADTHNDLRIEVAHALGAIGPGAEATLPALARMADNSDYAVRDAACDAMLKISPAGNGLAPALIGAVMNHDSVWVDRLARALHGSVFTRALQVRLHELSADDPDPGVRTAARRATEILIAQQ